MLELLAELGVDVRGSVRVADRPTTRKTRVVARSQQIVEGYPDGTYKPEVALDRGQMAVFIARAIATPTDRPGLTSYTPPPTPTFSDVPTSFWSARFIEYIAQPTVGVAHGYPDGVYRPEYACTRDLMAVYVARAFGLQ